MKRAKNVTTLCLGLALAVALPAIAQDAKTPALTPEQQAEMEAYTKAGTPGVSTLGLPTCWMVGAPS